MTHKCSTSSVCSSDLCISYSCIAWTDTKIILDTADPNYIDTVAKGDGVTGDMTTSDNGKTWTVTTIHIPQFSFGQSS